MATSPDPLTRGRALHQQGRPKEAMIWLLRAISQAPADVAVWQAAGLALLDAGEVVEAEASLRRAVKIGPMSPQAWVDLGRVLSIRGVRDEPVACWRKAVSLDPKHVEARVRLGSALAAKGQHTEAGEHLSVALTLRPNDAGAVAGAASLLELKGNAKDAWEIVRRHRGNDPRIAVIAASAGRRVGRSADALGRVRAAIRKAPASSLPILWHAQGDLLDALDRPEEAFAAWTKANDLRGAAFDPDAHVAAIDDLIARTTGRAWPAPVPGADRPVLVVGPPRTGSSLLEQALSCHPQVAAGGELETLRDIAIQLPRGGESYWAHALDRLTEADRSALLGTYLGRLSEVDSTSARVTDKMPNNLLHLGLLASFAPGTRVIRCVRDPEDTAFSCFRQPFGAGLPWATSLPWIRVWLSQAERLMDHWEATLPLRFLHVRYEQLVRDPEAVLREVLAFVDLPWDAVVLSPEASARPVTTASALEVQAPIHARSVGRSSRYLRLLGGPAPTP